jgi:ADP-dependent NAD(P)H-hydrate dehydratase / NAD(P)H-hydrate epimerase
LSAARLFVLTAARMREADAARVAAGTTVATLMERAARGALVAIEAWAGRPHGFRFAVVTGKGNNAGDGFVLARLLAARGARVTVHPVVPGDALAGPAREAFDGLAGSGARVAGADGDEAIAPGTDVVVDALLGTGSTGALAPPYAAAVAAIAAARAGGARVVALDLPSGFDADSGRPLADGGPTDEAHLPVTFAHPKPVHVLYPGRAACGRLAVVDIGVEPVAPGEDAELLGEALVASLLPRRAPTAHKGDAGKVLVIGGSAGLTGAVVLTSTAALRAGAGVVTAAVPASVNDALEAAMIEPMTWPLPESAERVLATSAVPLLLARAGQVDAVALGPGLSRAAEAGELARRIVAAASAPIVLDADGLFAFVDRAGELARRTHGVPLVVTPHLVEMERLTGIAPAELDRGRLSLPARFAREWNAVVVLKGAPTVIAAPDGRVSVNPTGNPGMATAGMGDVLTGMIAAFLAQGLAPYDAARVAVFVHGLAADVAHERVGTLSLVAGDVTATLPQVLCRLESGPAGTRSSARTLPPDRIAPDPPETTRSP